jgi:hypothetical protein
MGKPLLSHTIATSLASANRLVLRLEKTAVKLNLPLNWQFWGGLAIVLSTGIGAVSFGLLLRQSAVAGNCEHVFWPFASASFRLYCAQGAAEKQTLEELLKAIKLIDGLGKDHPLHPEINRRIEAWSTQVLDLAEQSFHQGQLQRAISFAQQISAGTTAHPLVVERINAWRKIWAEGEAIHQRVEAALNDQDWRRAFSIATQLLSVDNRYWSREKFQAINQRIILAQMDDSKLGRARVLRQRGGLTNLKEAMKIALQLPAQSDFYKSARQLVKNISQSMIEIADQALGQQDLALALEAVQLIPEDSPLWPQAQDFITLANAESWAWADTVLGLEAAIAQVRSIGPDRPLYSKAQILIQRWQSDIQTVKILDRARQYAEAGGVENLQVAINLSQQIPLSGSDARRRAAQKSGQEWLDALQTLQDQPLLDRAEQMAAIGSPESLQVAIALAMQIQVGRALYPSAQSRIKLWREFQQSALNPPLVPLPLVTAPDQAWLDRAGAFARQGSPQSLAKAIQIANQVPPNSTQRPEAEQAISQWGQELLILARAEAINNRAVAIAIAQQIPPFCDAYSEAQSLIQSWQGTP